MLHVRYLTYMLDILSRLCYMYAFDVMHMLHYIMHVTLRVSCWYHTYVICTLYYTFLHTFTYVFMYLFIHVFPWLSKFQNAYPNSISDATLYTLHRAQSSPKTNQESIEQGSFLTKSFPSLSDLIHGAKIYRSQQYSEKSGVVRQDDSLGLIFTCWCPLKWACFISRAPELSSRLCW